MEVKTQARGRVVAGLLVLLMLKGCSVSPMLHVFNHTQVPISFEAGGEHHAAGPMASASFVLEAPVVGNAADCRLEYEAPYPPPEYIRTGFFRAHIRMQIEPGGLLYLLQPGAQSPADVTGQRQPRGYPVAPSATGKCDWGTGGQLNSP